MSQSNGAGTSTSTSNSDELVSSLSSLGIPRNHVTVGLSNWISCTKQYKSLFVNRRLPDVGWSDVQIQQFLFLLSTLDTNNKVVASQQQQQEDDEGEGGGGGSSGRWCGVGEREGRVYSSLVSQRHYGFSHGVGRSGDITEPQPKAVGSSVLAKLTLLLTLDAVRRGSGLDARTSAAHGIVLPLCTGMSMSLVLSSLRQQQQEQQEEQQQPEKNVVLWSRIDQKSCYKAIQSAGLICVVVPTALRGDEVVTDLEAMERALDDNDGRVLAVVTTTSCFAPRAPDRADEVSRLCHRRDICHVINNAYGLQCGATSRLINRACAVGRVDAVVCSTDKNFLVPVGGAVVVSPSERVIATVGKVYAGRASASPAVDLFITLLSMGLRGYRHLLSSRSALVDEIFAKKFRQVAERHGERLLDCPTNSISFGMTLDNLLVDAEKKDDQDDESYRKSIGIRITSFGSMLFSRCVSGTRVVPRFVTKTMNKDEFKGFGSSVDDYPHAYMTAACAIGVTAAEVNEFFVRLDKTIREFKKKQTKKK